MRIERIGDATLYCGDCLEVLPEVSDFGHVITDPPYMLRCSSDSRGKLNPWADLCNGSAFITQWMGLCTEKMKNSGALWSFLNWRSIPAFMRAGFDIGYPMESLLVWDKMWPGPGTQLRPRYELVALYPVHGYRIADRSAPDIRAEKWSAIKPHGHPAEKPEKLTDWLVSLSRINEGICDPFMGSGTTGVSALKAGRKFIGVEMDEKWFDAACRRIEKTVRELERVE